MIMIVIGVAWFLFSIYAGFEEGAEIAVVMIMIILDGILWMIANLCLGAWFDEAHLAYSAPLEQIEGTEYYLINTYPFIAEYDVDRESGRRPEGDINWDIAYGDENRVDIYEHDALWWLSVEMDQNYTEFIVTVEDEDLVFTP